MNRTALRPLSVLAAAAAVVVIGASPASAHATIGPTAVQPGEQVTPIDIDFQVTVKAPKTALGSYLFRTLQTHADGWVEPWVYDKEPYPAPRVQVGSATKTVNGEGSKEDPRCFGPTKQPKDYGSHDGKAGDPKPCTVTKPRGSLVRAAGATHAAVVVAPLTVTKAAAPSTHVATPGQLPSTGLPAGPGAAALLLLLGATAVRSLRSAR